MPERKPKEEKPLEIGDVVVLKSGNFRMVISGFSDARDDGSRWATVTQAYFVERGIEPPAEIFRTGMIDERCLKRLREDK